MRPVRPLALVLALLPTAAACGDDDRRSEPTPAQLGAETPVRAPVETFVAAPDYEGLVGLLRQGHERARSELGPHRLRYSATITTAPAGIDPRSDEPLPDVPPERPILQKFAVIDTLELVWGSEPGGPPRLSLDQHNEHQHGRALILIDEREWANLDGRGWFERPAESDLWTLWADDAQHAVLDLVELAGPHAELGDVELTDLGGRSAVRVTLQPSEREHPDRTVDGPTPWRHDADVRVITATIVLDRATGLWRSAAIELDWTFEDSAGRELRGHARLDASVEILAEPPPIAPPPEFAPVPERDRPELLRERLLDGLAGP